MRNNALILFQRSENSSRASRSLKKLNIIIIIQSCCLLVTSPPLSLGVGLADDQAYTCFARIGTVVDKLKRVKKRKLLFPQ